MHADAEQETGPRTETFTIECRYEIGRVTWKDPYWYEVEPVQRPTDDVLESVHRELRALIAVGDAPAMLTKAPDWRQKALLVRTLVEIGWLNSVDFTPLLEYLTAPMWEALAPLREALDLKPTEQCRPVWRVGIVGDRPASIAEDFLPPYVLDEPNPDYDEPSGCEVLEIIDQVLLAGWALIKIGKDLDGATRWEPDPLLYTFQRM